MSEKSTPRAITLSFSRAGALTLLEELEDLPYRTLSSSSHLMELRQKLEKMLADPTWK